MIDCMPDFPEFYRALNGRDPFPWQARLAALVAEEERWPCEIGIPTGLGKTACLEVAVWWLASQADREPAHRTAPTRIWWVVNRRLLVDSTAAQAEAMAAALEDPRSVNESRDGHRALFAVADRLRKLSADHDAPPLEVISLRGGIASRTPTDPSRPTIVLCTVPMYGSRLLFRGYGSRLRAVDAAMAGTDSLVLVDEAHLAPHLKSLMSGLVDCWPSVQPILCGARSFATIVALTATGSASPKNRFDLDEEDERNATVRKRLDAVKDTTLVVEDSGDIARHLADATVGLMNGAHDPSTFLVFANTPRTARMVFARLREPRTRREPARDAVLLTGLAREADAERIRTRILDPGFGMLAQTTARKREKHLVVVATQTLEVGADVDAEFLVTEACGVRALTQRLGRLNRLGGFVHSRAVYVHVPPKRKRGQAEDFWPVYGQEPESVLARLQAAQRSDGTINLSPRQVAGVLGQPGDDPGRAPEVLPGILWEWVKTTTPPEGEAPVEPYFNGIKERGYTVSVIWRAYVPKAGERLWPRAMERETVDVPLADLREVLEKEDVVQRLAGDGVVDECPSPENLRPGDQIVLPMDCGLLDEYGWDPLAADTVADVSLAERGLPLDAVALQRLCGVEVGDRIAKACDRDEDEGFEAERDEAILGILDALGNAGPPLRWDHAEWSQFTASLQPRLVVPRNEVPRLLVANARPDPRIGEFDETSISLGATAELDAHGEAVGVRAGVVAQRIGVPAELTELLALAGRVHDIGKADSRFQRWLDPQGEAAVHMAKSNAPFHQWESMRAQSGWPRGGRHEDLSARLVRAWLDENPQWGTDLTRNLLIHLVISHHGKGRPLVPPVADGTHGAVRGIVSGTVVEVPADLAAVDWDQPARFRGLNDCYGPWGLALLEAIVIRSDHTVSARGDVLLGAQ